MSRTDWTKMVTGKELATEKNLRKKLFVTQKIASKDLPEYVDAGWEKYKDFKSNKYVGITKEKPVSEQFEDLIWLLFTNMGFSDLNAGNGFQLAYDFRDDSLLERVSVIAADEETVLIVSCHATDSLIENSFAAEINQFSEKIAGLRKEILKQYPGRKTKFIWATHNYISNRRDLALLDKAGIAYFSESTIEYYSELAKHLGSCSRYPTV